MSRLEKQLALLLGLFLVLAGVSMGFSLLTARIVSQNAREDNAELAAVEKHDRDALRTALYRSCLRGNSVRAYAQAYPHIRGLASPHRLPILDCTPNLRGRSATVLPLAEQRGYVRRWVSGDVSKADLGLCEESTPINKPC